MGWNNTLICDIPARTTKTAAGKERSPSLDLYVPLRAVNELSPIAHVGPAAPPHLFVHGATDRLVRPRQSRRMHEALRAAGVRSELLIIPDRDHAMPPGDSPGINRTIDFFDSFTSAGR